jgi:hypothetical protein
VNGDAVAAAVGAFLAVLASKWLDRRAAERRTLTEADQQWMASTHLEESASA